MTTQVMGILNVTPDSFSDGGRFFATDAAVNEALVMVDAGAHIIDVGGESTRPGSGGISVAEELDRVVPVIEKIRARTDVTISVDTSKPEVMREAVHAGAGFINDVRALREDGALEFAAHAGVPVCLMHMQGEPRTMQDEPVYDDVVGEVSAFLEDRAQRCESAGLAGDQIFVDPGFGFGKTYAHNLQLFSELETLVSRGRPVVVGVSRKRMIATMIGDEKRERTAGSVVLGVLAAQKGAAILRVHDVRQTVDALAVVNALSTFNQRTTD